MLSLEAIAMPHLLKLMISTWLLLIQLIVLTLITSSKARAPELKMITRDSYWNDKAPFYTANASKFIEKCLLDLRNIFSNQENIRKNPSWNNKIYLAKKSFLVPSIRKFILI